jgi:hypothetical protein
LVSGISSSPASKAGVRFLTFFDRDYVCVAETTLTLNGEEVDVSTIWLGINHRFGDGAPLIFETMVFYDGPEDLQANAT